MDYTLRKGSGAEKVDPHRRAVREFPDSRAGGEDQGVTGLLILILLIGLIALWSRLSGLERRFARLEATLQAPAPPLPHAATPPASPVAAAPAPGPPVPAPVRPAPVRAPVAPRETPTPATAVAAAPAKPPSAPEPSRFALWTRQLREQLSGQEWEAIVGGSFLNKLGVLVLVVGVSLFLGYSLTHLGPAGKIAVGVGVSGAMLASGVLLERRPRYVVFARGLLGGGWATLYFTTYAMHGLEAARIIHDPLAGIGALAAVAAGMILHSLRYRSEVVTGLAYVVGFVTLVLSPVSGFALVASVPLALSLLVVARRFGWDDMALMGLLFTYAAYALRYTAEPAPRTGVIALGLYWLLFEAYDLSRLAQREPVRSVTRALSPLNLVGFVGVAMLTAPVRTVHGLPLLLGVTALGYLASALVRARLRPPSSFPPSADPVARAAAGGYEGAITVTAGLLVPAILLRFDGVTADLALLLEAEWLFVAGLRLGQPYLRTLAAGVAAVTLLHVGLVHLPRPDRIGLAGVTLHAWTPIAVLLAALLYANDATGRPSRGSPWLRPEHGYSYAATALVVVILGFELGAAHRGIAWLALAGVLLEVALRLEREDFFLQSAGAAIAGALTLVIVNVLGLGRDVPMTTWGWLGPAALLAYAGALRLHRVPVGVLPGVAREVGRDAATAGGTVFLAALAWHLLPTPVVAVAWAIVALGLIEAGVAVPLASLRLQGLILLAATCARLLVANFTSHAETAGLSHRVLTVAPVVLLLYHVRGRLAGGAAPWEPSGARGCVYAAAVLMVFLARFELGRVLAVDAWAILLVVLLWAGVRRNDADLRWQSYGLAVLVFVRSWATNFYSPESLAGMPGRVATGVLAIAALYAAEFLAPDRVAAGASRVDRHARAGFAFLATALLTLLLAYEVSGNVLTVAWGLEGVLLLAVGFVAKERMLRLLGLVVLLGCILKVFLYDLRELEPLARILSFVVLGLVLLGVSLVYTRFRERVARYL
jgi:uncharacterized membrane protein